MLGSRNNGRRLSKIAVLVQTTQDMIARMTAMALFPDFCL